MGYKITIDGPSGSGKGFIASEISKRLNSLNIDTGAMYRAFGLYCIENGIDLENEEQVEFALNNTKITFKPDLDVLRIYLNDEDVSGRIRTEQVGMLASKVSAIPVVRKYMVEKQREIAGENNVIMEGRDIGSVVFPNAELKIFLTASKEIRATRRLNDLLNKGMKVTYEEVLEDITKRDESDINKKISPLIKTDDMIELDTTLLSKEQVINEVLRLVVKKGLVDFKDV